MSKIKIFGIITLICIILLMIFPNIVLKGYSPVWFLLGLWGSEVSFGKNED